MSRFKLSIDEDILLIRTSPGLINYVMFFKNWSYVLELPVNRINSVELERRAGILTLIVLKNSKDGREKHIAVSLVKASKKQVDFIRNALPSIISNRLPMNEINDLKRKYLD